MEAKVLVVMVVDGGGAGCNRGRRNFAMQSRSHAATCAAAALLRLSLWRASEHVLSCESLRLHHKQAPPSSMRVCLTFCLVLHSLDPTFVA